MKNFLFGKVLNMVGWANLKGDREPNLLECEDLAKAIINRHVVIQILLAFPKLDFEVRIPSPSWL